MTETKLTPDQERKLRDVPAHLRGMYRRAVTGRSRAAAIWFHCLECVAWSPSEVRGSTARGCACYPFRFRGSRGAEDSAELCEERNDPVAESPEAPENGAQPEGGPDPRPEAVQP
jgi:hypothetical protein